MVFSHNRLAVLLLALLLVGCTMSGGNSTPVLTPLPSGPVTFTTSDGIKLGGNIVGNGSTAVILAHMRPVDQTSWKEFAGELAGRGFTALTFDFRGYGESEGQRDYGALDKDISAAADFLRTNGYSKIVCIGASMGGTACAKAARGAKLDGLGVLSSPLEMVPPLTVGKEDLAELTCPKLFLAAEEDTPYSDEVRQMHDFSPEPRTIVLLPGFGHGTELFDRPSAEQFRTALFTFLDPLK